VDTLFRQGEGYRYHSPMIVVESNIPADLSVNDAIPGGEFRARMVSGVVRWEESAWSTQNRESEEWEGG
jgi:hypothetical protein